MTKLIAILTIVFVLGVRYFTSLPSYKTGDKIRVTDYVSQDGKVGGFRVKLSPQPSYGDLVVIEGTVSGKELKDVKLVELRPSNDILVGIRKRLISFYEKSLPPPHGSLIAGMSVGAKRSLSSEFYNKLISTGTSHVVVASGMNLTLLSGFIFNLLVNFWTRKRAITVTLVSILIYCALVGFEPPIVRAGLMLSIVYLSQLTGKLISAVRALFLAAIVMLFLVPSWITDIGFILSFSATLSLILFEAKVDRLIRFVPNLIREYLSTSLSVQILTAPVILIAFGRVNILSPLINALVAPVITPVTIIGVLAGFVNLIYEPAAKLILYVVYPLTSWFIFVINLFS